MSIKTSKNLILSHQRQWAESKGFNVDDSSYLSDVSCNLRAPLSDTALAGYEHGSGSELVDSGNRKAKMRALHSSSALVANFFDYWSLNDASPLLKVLNIDGQLTTIGFESQFPTGLGGTPPNLDLSLELNDGNVIGIESKFTEWLTKKSYTKPPFKEKYFSGGIKRWGDLGLPNCQSLAENMQNKSINFGYLDASQLLKHALGLATQKNMNCSLMYVYFDVNGKESLMHYDEINRFEVAIGNELNFKVLTYQYLFEELTKAPNLNSGYIDYLQSRYFPEIAINSRS